MASQTPLAAGPVIRRLSQIVGYVVLLGAALFLSAGRLDWTRAWIYLALNVGGLAVSATILLRFNPEVVVERGKKHAGTKGFDKVFMAIYTLLLVALPVLAGLDAARFGWSTMPLGTVYAGAALFAVSVVPSVWALAVNPFAETTVRIQEERGQRVITAGPYRFVRHPMYVGVIVQNLGAPLVLGSAWAFLPAAGILALIVARTALEDRTLRNELPGYAEYARRTRHRLLPGIW